MREKLFIDVTLQVSHRITPAYAGKTLHNVTGATGTRDHPRVCGKNLRLALPLRTRGGSPPRMREKRTATLRARLIAGITPAYAGKTSIGKSPKIASKDHPRVCGKN